MSIVIPAAVRKLYAEARRTRLLAHAPYSKFLVGAAFLTKGGKSFSGCNVENASYGGTICAERTAIVKAVSEGLVGASRSQKLSDLVVVAENASGKAVAPCGLCLQVLAEFCDGNLRIWSATPTRIESCFTLDQLLPIRFGRGDLRKR